MTTAWVIFVLLGQGVAWAKAPTITRPDDEVVHWSAGSGDKIQFGADKGEFLRHQGKVKRKGCRVFLGKQAIAVRKDGGFELDTPIKAPEGRVQVDIICTDRIDRWFFTYKWKKPTPFFSIKVQDGAQPTPVDASVELDNAERAPAEWIERSEWQRGIIMK